MFIAHTPKHTYFFLTHFNVLAHKQCLAETPTPAVNITAHQIIDGMTKLDGYMNYKYTKSDSHIFSENSCV